MLQLYYAILVYTYITEEWREKLQLCILLDRFTTCGQLTN